ncbi:MAG TPA: hypothetical protein VNJ10_10930 [Sphingomonas sp.]|nr:hypothetical protein [Sphingomonas sp.]
MTGLARGEASPICDPAPAVRDPSPRKAYLRTETAISIVINAVLSLGFFLLAFGLAPSTPVPVAGLGGYAVDFLPQSFMIALMSTLMPGIITAGRIRAGRIGGQAQSTGALLRRSVLTAVAAMLVGIAIAAILLVVATKAALPWGPALFAKILYGGLLAAIVTPIGLRHALRGTDLH